MKEYLNSAPIQGNVDASDKTTGIYVDLKVELEEEGDVIANFPL